MAGGSTSLAFPRQKPSSVEKILCSSVARKVAENNMIYLVGERFLLILKKFQESVKYAEKIRPNEYKTRILA